MEIAAVINTFNEAGKLEGCLESVYKWVDEILVVDQGSTDGTLEIAKKYKAKIVPHERVPYVEIVRNFGVDKANGKWVLVLDPDERVPKTLSEKLRKISKEDSCDAVNIPRKNIIFGSWLKHTNCWPDKHIRFFKKGKVFWTERIHLYPKVEGKVLDLPVTEQLAVEHLNYDSIREFLERQNRYTDIGAKNRFEGGKKFSWKKSWPVILRLLITGFIFTIFLFIYSIFI